MDERRRKLIDRIVKLFRLGSNAANTTEHEMMLAVSKARQMMADHAISMTEVQDLKGEDVVSRMDARIRNVPVYTRAGTRLADYDWCVATAVGILTDTEAFQRGSWGQNKKGGYGPTISVLFVGDEDDVHLAGELFHLWLTDVRKLTRKKYGNGKNLWSLLHTSYAIGMGVRLGERAREIIHLSNADATTWGLVVTSKRDAIARWKAQHINPNGGRARRPSSLDYNAYAAGKRDGDQVNMKTKIVT